MDRFTRNQGLESSSGTGIEVISVVRRLGSRIYGTKFAETSDPLFVTNGWEEIRLLPAEFTSSFPSAEFWSS